MTLHVMNGLLGLMPPSGGQQSQAPWWSSLVPLLLMIFVFYFIFIRPQQRKAREHDTLIKGLRKGDKVLTSGGIIGTVVAVREKTVSIRSEETKMEILKTAVSEVTERGGNGSGSEG